MEIQDAAWERFLQTGLVSDYLQYCSARGAAARRVLDRDRVKGQKVDSSAAKTAFELGATPGAIT